MFDTGRGHRRVSMQDGWLEEAEKKQVGTVYISDVGKHDLNHVEGGHGLRVIMEGAHEIPSGQHRRNDHTARTTDITGRQSQRTCAPCVQHDLQSHGAWLKQCLFAAYPTTQTCSFVSSKGGTNAVPRAVLTSISSEAQEPWYCAGIVLVPSARCGPEGMPFQAMSYCISRLRSSQRSGHFQATRGAETSSQSAWATHDPSPAIALQPLCSDMRIETCACWTAEDYIAARALIVVRWGPVAAS
jgi:hypothetical protein